MNSAQFIHVVPREVGMAKKIACTADCMATRKAHVIAAGIGNDVSIQSSKNKGYVP